MNRARLTGRIQVPLPPREAFRLFTPCGERDWADGWEPSFPAPVTDDAEPGTVFETAAHGHPTIWLVLDRQVDRQISYARVTPHDTAGTVTVTLDDAGGRSDVTVTYELTALTAAAAQRLAGFADRYAAYLRSWETAIEAALHR